MRSERDLKRMIAMLELKILQNTLFGYIIRHYAQKVNMFYISALSGETAGKWLRKEKKAASGKEILQQKSIIFCCCDSLPDAASPDSAIGTAVSVSPGSAQPMSLSAGFRLWIQLSKPIAFSQARHGTGLPNRNPCAYLHPICLSSAACHGYSTPSAMTVYFRLFEIPII